MLELKNIKKDYALKDQEPVHALKGVSVNFRSNEFVAILGHSGCGKTTLLNIIGGLDHYNSGDLVIKGKSTKKFADRDWDTYRNHSVGFVFQSYNLISHQTLLKNVELALTIAGVSKEEKTKRAMAALDKVGLQGLYKKKPNQLSGGQMQRVAIARALVNDPEVVLADEPTGALDSETSVQIMDLLKEVAENHLVIMVTHNPELAEKYATRIVRMKDGELIDDTMPFDGNAEIKEKKVNKGSKKKTSMSFFAAMKLSFSNLISKLNRTLLVAVAGSIGIIGVSAILGVSCGINDYIGSMENDLLSSYPIALYEQTVDASSMISNLSASDSQEVAKFDKTTKIGLDSMISYLMEKYSDITNIKTNDINEDLMTYIDEMPSGAYAAINMDYSIDATNNFFTAFTKEKAHPENTQIVSINGLTQSYIQTLMTVEGFGEYASFTSMFANFMKQLPVEEDYSLTQYDFITGSKFPSEANELMLVVDKKSTLTDLILAQMGFYPQDEFLNIAKKAVKSNELYKKYNNKEITKEKYNEELRKLDEQYPYDKSFSFEDILNHEFYYFPHQTLYKPNPSFVSHSQVSTSLSGKVPSISPIYANDTTILGLSYIPGSDAMSGTLILLDEENNIDMNTTIFFKRAKDSPRNPDASVVDGKWEFSMNGTSLSLSIHSQNKQESPEGITYDASGLLNFGGLPIQLTSGRITEVEPETKDYYYHYAINEEGYGDNYQDMLANPEKYGGFKVKISAVLRAKDETMFGSLSRGVYFTKAFGERFREDAQASDAVNEFVSHIEEDRFNQSTYNAYVSFDYDDYTNEPTTGHPTPMSGYASALNSGSGVSSLLSNILGSFLGGAAGTNNLDTDKAHLRSMAGLKVSDIAYNPIYVDLSETATGTMYAYAFKQFDDGSIIENAPYPGIKMDKTFSDEIYLYKFEEQFNQVQFIEWDETAKTELPLTSDTLTVTSENREKKCLYDYSIGEWSETLLDHKAGKKHLTLDAPQTISFYPSDFSTKDRIVNYLKRWNSNETITVGDKTLTKNQRQEITITDNISIIVTVVSTLITAVSTALICFTSLSLVVSCFMIAVITVISVMERIKEIGVIRSLGGRKKDVSRLFIAENLITGFASGAIGILMTYILQIILNIVVRPMGIPKICALPWYYALMMVLISILLSVLSGLIPSLKASKSDPVNALRSE